jgi:hypothetical protein
MPLKSVMCVQDDGTMEIDIGSITINTSNICVTVSTSEILNDSASTNRTTTLEGILMHW